MENQETSRIQSSIQKRSRLNRNVLACPVNFIQNCQAGLRLLEENGCTVHANLHGRPFTRAELLQAIPEMDAVIAAFEPWDEEAFQAAPRLKVVTRSGTGLDSVDTDAARRHGVMVCNCPGANAASVAEHTVALLLALARDIPRLDAAVHAGQWPRTTFSELGSKTFGIVGFGAIGQRVARLLCGFGMRLLAHNRSPRPDAAAALGVHMCSLEDLFRESDFISLHLPAGPDTRQLINAASIARMKPGVRIINTARAALLDDAAVCDALKVGRIAGLASDVFSAEPIETDNPLIQAPHVIGTPHVASASLESQQRLGQMAAQSVIAVFAGREPENRQA